MFVNELRMVAVVYAYSLLLCLQLLTLLSASLLKGYIQNSEINSWYFLW